MKLRCSEHALQVTADPSFDQSTLSSRFGPLIFIELEPLSCMWHSIICPRFTFSLHTIMAPHCHNYQQLPYERTFSVYETLQCKRPSWPKAARLGILLYEGRAPLFASFAVAFLTWKSSLPVATYFSCCNLLSPSRPGPARPPRRHQHTPMLRICHLEPCHI